MLRKRLPHPCRLDDGIPVIDGRLSPLALRLRITPVLPAIKPNQEKFEFEFEFAFDFGQQTQPHSVAS